MGNGSEVMSELLVIWCCNMVSVLKIHENEEGNKEVVTECWRKLIANALIKFSDFQDFRLSV